MGILVRPVDLGRYLVPLGVLLSLFSCAIHKTVPARLYNLETAEVLRASFNFYGTTRGDINVTLPSGETFQGEYVTVPHGEVTWGNIFASVWTPTSSAYGTGSGYAESSSYPYRGSAVATSNRGTIIECEYVTNTSRFNPEGYGACRNNHGDTYRLMFGK